MKSRIIRLVVLYATALLVMVAGHALFMLCLPGIYGDVSAGSRLDVLSAGMKIDRAVASYITIIPGLISILSVWLLTQVTDRAMRIYYLIISFIVAGVMTLDTILYSFWGMKLDTTPFFYFTSSPSLAFASVSVWQVIAGMIVWVTASFLIWLIFIGAIKITPLSEPRRIQRPGIANLVLFLLTALLFIPIRGGFTVATTNLSSAYFSTDQRLNHAAVNPIFSLLYSATHPSGIDSGMRFMEPEEAARIAAPLKTGKYNSSAADSLLNVDRPDILLIILESFSSNLLPVQGGEPVALKLDSIARSGLLLNEVYASSFRTDRAIPAILSGLPALPSEPITKNTALIERLPGLPDALRKAGYKTTYYYGGDINFTNQRAYLRSAGIDSIVSDNDFPLSLRISKWGVADGPLFERVIADENLRDDRSPRFTVVQTLSSHEPFDVGNFHRHSDPAANAFAYTDSCTGAFIDSLALSPRWGRTLIVLIPDHYGCYPKGLDERSRHHIPLIMTGGALALRGKIDTPAAQSDLAATLLAALGLNAGEFPFSRDILATPSPQLSMFSEPDFAAAIAPDGTMTRLALTGAPLPGDSSSRRLAAYLQNLYTYLSKLSSPSAK